MELGVRVDIFLDFVIKWRGGNKLTYQEIPNNPEGSKVLMIAPFGVKQKIGRSGRQCSPDKGCEVLGGELTHEYLDENDSENFADSDDAHSLQKWGEVIIEYYEG